MRCFFCPNPAAHPATGQQYTERALACRDCAVAFWTWFRAHQYRGTRASRETGCPTFYECISSAPRRVTVSPER